MWSKYMRTPSRLANLNAGTMSLSLVTTTITSTRCCNDSLAISRPILRSTPFCWMFGTKSLLVNALVPFFWCYLVPVFRASNPVPIFHLLSRRHPGIAPSFAEATDSRKSENCLTDRARNHLQDYVIALWQVAHHKNIFREDQDLLKDREIWFAQIRLWFQRKLHDRRFWDFFEKSPVFS